MPGKYLEYIKCGRYVVPVEITFLSSTSIDNFPGGNFSSSVHRSTSKWVEPGHWKEIKAMLKPAVEACTTADGFSKSPHITFGQEIGLGYVLAHDTSKDKSPFLAVLDVKKNCWTDDEDDIGVDESSGLRDYGGMFKNFPPTKTYVRACVMKKTGISSEDSKKLRKELGFKSDDMRNYLQSTANPVPSTASSLQDKEKKELHSFSSPFNSINLNRRFNFSNSNSTDTIERMRPYTEGARKSLSETRNEHFSRLPEGSYYEERDDDEDKSFQTIVPHSADLVDAQSDDDTFSLPDLDMDIQQQQPKPKPRVISTLPSIVPRRQELSDDDSDDPQSGSTAMRRFTIEERSKPKPPVKPKPKTPATNSMFFTNDGAFERAICGGRPPDKSVKQRPPQPLLGSELLMAKNLRTSVSTTLANSPIIASSKLMQAKERQTLEKLAQERQALDKNVAVRQAKEAHGLQKQLRQKKPKKLSPRKKPKGELKTVVSPTRPRLNTTPPRKLKKVKKTVSTPVPASTPNLTPSTPPKRIDSIKRKAPVPASPDITAKRVAIDTSLNASFSKDLSLSHLGPSRSIPGASTNAATETEPMSLVARYQAAELRRMSEKPMNARTMAFLGLPETSRSPPVLLDQSRTSNYGIPNVAQSKPHEIAKPSESANMLPVAATHAASYSSQQVSSPEPKVIGEKRVKIRKRKQKEVGEVRIRPKRGESVAKGSNRIPSEADKEIDDTVAQLDPEMPILTPEVELGVLQIVSHVPVTKAEPVSPQNQLQPGSPVRKKKAQGKEKKSKASKKVGMDKATSTRSANNSEDESEKTDGNPDRSVGISNTPAPAVPNPAPAVPTEDNPVAQELPIRIKQERLTPIPIRSREFDEHGVPRQIEQITLDDDPFSFDHVHEVAKSNSPDAADSVSFEEPVERSMMPPPAKRPPRTPKKDVPPRFNLNPPSTSRVSERPGPGPSTAMTGRSDTSKLSSYNLLTNSNLLSAGMGLMRKFAMNKLDSHEVGRRLGFKASENTEKGQLSPERRQRAVSPDITSYPPVPKNRKPYRRSQSDDTEDKTTPHPFFLNRRESDEEAYLSDQDSQDQEGGEALVREVLNRSGGVDANAADLYDPSEEGDEFDLSQQSHCMLNIVPEYQRKSRLYKIHSKNITDLTYEELIDHYTHIKPALRAIFEDKTNYRQTLYLQGPAGKRKLKQIMVSVPFDNDQCSTLLTLLFEYFVPDLTARQSYSDYINYVMVPEALIKIYARVNDISEEMAETEMRFGACYDEPIAERE